MSEPSCSLSLISWHHQVKVNAGQDWELIIPPLWTQISPREEPELGTGQKRKSLRKERDCLVLTNGKITWHQLESASPTIGTCSLRNLSVVSEWPPANHSTIPHLHGGGGLPAITEPLPPSISISGSYKSCRKPFNATADLILCLGQALGCREGGESLETTINNTQFLTSRSFPHHCGGMGI